MTITPTTDAAPTETADEAELVEAADDDVAESAMPVPQADGAGTEAGGAARRPRAQGRGHAPQQAARSPRPPRPAGTPRAGGPARGRALPRVARPAEVPSPEHHHLPGWVRREFARARPPLGDLLALLEGEPREELRRRVDELTAAISSGKFSRAWQYPEVVAAGREAYERQRRAQASDAAARRTLDAAKRRAGDAIREAALPAETAGRLQRALRVAESEEAVATVQSELSSITATARASVDRKREREIERTRSRIRRSAPRAAAGEPAETWQDVLRRFAEQQSRQEAETV